VAGPVDKGCVSKGLIVKAIRQALPYVLPLQCNTTIPGTF
jgi:hypothetical protein